MLYPTYRAPAPKALIFPSVPLEKRPGISGRVHSFFQSSLNKILTIFILPGSLNKSKPKRRLAATQLPGSSFVSIATSDNAILDGMLVRGSQRKAILYVGGNGDLFEAKYFRMLQMRQHIGDVNLFFFNPRGVGKSRGVPNGNRLPMDVHAAFRYLVDVEGLNPNDIVIFGHSLGGGHGALGGALVQEDFPDHEINYVSYNSFRDITSVMKDAVLRVFPFWKGAREFLSDRIERLIHRFQWQMDEVAGVQKIRGRKLVIVNKGDSVIRTPASLYQGLKELNTPLDVAVLKMDAGDKRNQPWWNRFGPLPGRWQHMRPFNQWETFEISNRLKEMLRIPHAPSLDPGSDVLERNNPHPAWARRHLQISEAIQRQRQLLAFPEGLSEKERSCRLQIARDAMSLLDKSLNRVKKSQTPADWLRVHLKGSTDYSRALASTQAQVLSDLVRIASSKTDGSSVGCHAQAQLETLPGNTAQQSLT